jgi:flagellar hook-associated protein 2
MGRIQSSIGLITGTDIVGTVDQLIALSARSRDALVGRTDTLRQQQQALAELTASVIGVQLAGNGLSNRSLFRSKAATSSASDALSAAAGSDAAAATHVVRTLETAATHNVKSLQRYSSADDALGFTGTLRVNPDGGLIDNSVALVDLNNGRGVEAGSIRITNRDKKTSDIDLSDALTMNDVIDAINDQALGVRATTVGNAIQLIDTTGKNNNIKVEQIGSEETAADLGLWGLSVDAVTATGLELDLPVGAAALRGAAITELNGGSGIGPLTDLDITLSDSSNASIDLSGAESTSEIVDAINGSGLSLIATLNDARNGFRVRDVSGGLGTFSISSADDTADELGLTGSTTDDIIVGSNVNRQSVTIDTLLADLNQGDGIDDGSFTITDSAGSVGAVNIKVEGITTVGELVDAINDLSIGVTASLNEAGDGIDVIDTAAGSSTLTIADTGSGTAAADLGIAGTATDQVVRGTLESALVGTQAGVITVEAADTLNTLAEKINEDGRYSDASIQQNDDGTYSLRVRSTRGGEAGRIAINALGFELDLRTENRGTDARIAVSTDGGAERFHTSSDGVFSLDGSDISASVTLSTTLQSISIGASRGSFTVTDSAGAISAVNITTEGITTIGGLVDAINNLGIGVTASINEAGTGIAVVDTADGSETLTITDTGNGTAAASLGISGTATTQTINGSSESALVGPAQDADSSDSTSGLVLTLKELSDSPVTVTVEEDTQAVVSAAKTFVDQFNLLVDKVDSLTFYDPNSEEVGLLFGSSESLRIENGFSRLLSGSVVGAGGFRSIGQVGMRINDQGKLEFNSGDLTSALQSNHADVEDFFTSDETGLADRLSNLADRIAGVSDGLLLNRSETLTTQIETNNNRILDMNERLNNERERLLRQFQSTELAIARIQSDQSAINQIQQSISQNQS